MGRHNPTPQTPEKIDVLAAELVAHAEALRGIARVMRDNSTPQVMAPSEETAEKAIAAIGRFNRTLTRAYREQIARPNARPVNGEASANPGEISQEISEKRTRKDRKHKPETSTQ